MILLSFLQFADPVSQCILVHLLRTIKVSCFFLVFFVVFVHVLGKTRFLEIYSCFLILRNYYNFVRFRTRKCTVWNIELPATLDSLKTWAFKIEDSCHENFFYKMCDLGVRFMRQGILKMMIPTQWNLMILMESGENVFLIKLELYIKLQTSQSQIQTTYILKTIESFSFGLFLNLFWI